MSTFAPNAAELHELNRRAVIKWTCFIVGLLLLNLALCAVGVIAAVRTNPPVVKDYYTKAVHWDDRNKPAAPPPSDASSQSLTAP